MAGDASHVWTQGSRGQWVISITQLPNESFDELMLRAAQVCGRAYRAVPGYLPDLPQNNVVGYVHLINGSTYTLVRGQ